MAPEHVIANRKLLAKAGDDEKKIRKIVAEEGPGRRGELDGPRPSSVCGTPSLNELTSKRSQVSHAMVLNVLARVARRTRSRRCVGCSPTTMQPEAARGRLILPGRPDLPLLRQSRRGRAPEQTAVPGRSG